MGIVSEGLISGVSRLSWAGAGGVKGERFQGVASSGHLVTRSPQRETWHRGIRSLRIVVAGCVYGPAECAAFGVRGLSPRSYSVELEPVPAAISRGRGTLSAL